MTEKGLCDNGGCIRVILDGVDYLVTTMHQMKLYAPGEFLYLQSQGGEKKSFAVNPETWIEIDSLEFVCFPLPSRSWPQGITAARPKVPGASLFNNLTGTFHGMVNGELHFSTGRVEPPTSYIVGHHATTYPGWCGWPVQCGNQLVFMHYMGASPMNYCLPVGAVLEGIARQLAWRKRVALPKKEEGAQFAVAQEAVKSALESSPDSDDYLFCGALSMLKRHHGDVNAIEKRAVQLGQEEMGYSVMEKSTGRVYIIATQFMRAFDYEMDSKKFLNEDAGQTLDRVTDGNYYQEIDEYDYSQRTEQEKREDEQDEQEREARRERTREEREKEDDERLVAAAKAGSGMAIAAIGGLGISGDETSIATAYLCLCGSVDSLHVCAHKLNIRGLTPSKVREARAAMLSLSAPIISEQADNPDPQATAPPQPPVVAQAPTVTAPPQLEAPYAPQAVQEKKQADFHQAPDKAPVVAKVVVPQQTKEAAAPASQSQGVVLTAQARKRLNRKRKEAVKRQLAEALAEVDRLEAVSKAQVQPQQSKESKRSSKQALEGPFQKRTAPVIWQFIPDYDKLNWSPPVQVMDKKTSQLVVVEGVPVINRYFQMPDGRKMRWDSRYPQQVTILPKFLPPAPVLGLSLSALLGSVPSNTPAASGFASQAPPTIGVPLQTNTVNPIVPQ